MLSSGLALVVIKTNDVQQFLCLMEALILSRAWLGDAMIGLEGISARALSDAIGAIYDCAVDPERWNATIQQILALCDSSGCGICVHDLKNVQNDRLFEVGYDPDFSRLLSARFKENPYVASAMIAQVGDVMTLDSVCNDQELIETRFYKEVLKPYGYFHFIAVIALKNGGRFASLHAGRMLEAPRYGERETSLFELLSPHICRALAISDILDIKTLHSNVLEATLDGLASGVYLTRRDGQVVYMNAAAERQVKTGNALRIVDNRLVPTDSETRATIAKAISEAASDETGIASGGHSLAIPSDTAAGYVATLLPVERGRRQSIMAPFAASVAIFAQDPARVPIMPGEAFARLYNLTAAELRVLLALAQGLAAREAADMLGVGEPTVRTHVQRMFSKTGTSRQAELLQLLQGCAPPVDAG